MGDQVIISVASCACLTVGQISIVSETGPIPTCMDVGLHCKSFPRSLHLCTFSLMGWKSSGLS